MYKEHVLASGEVIWLTDKIKYFSRKPWEVGCAANAGEEAEVRWVVYFSTLEEAEKEYIQFG